jgi:hypothetical protein
MAVMAAMAQWAVMTMGGTLQLPSGQKLWHLPRQSPPLRYLLQPWTIFRFCNPIYFVQFLTVHHGLVLGRYRILSAHCGCCAAPNASRQRRASGTYDSTLHLRCALTVDSPRVPCTRKHRLPLKQKSQPAHVPTSLQLPHPTPRHHQPPKPPSKAFSPV